MWTLKETRFDRAVAELVVEHATSFLERPSNALTLVADERPLLVLVGALWLAARGGRTTDRQRTSHLGAGIIVTAILPHLMKRVVNQRRPDRCMVHGVRHGIPVSGRALDAFPSGHAMHIGVIAASLSRFFPRAAGRIWAASAVVASTRILVLAHWTTDVLAGILMGIGIERALWRLRPSSRRP